ncbi:isochorismatase [Gluconobacter sp. DsW_056]|uniref:isochorismatase family protein n=1 Tax=Gluconobacter sp. DsW_056 TaxID=1511209 RepID=UPI000A37CC15|nr:isochorismatase family protein [Gluconobacter sp. DsW_056]OUI80752.1 isochorismatase [Gluconobacter sp. DsW_056]
MTLETFRQIYGLDDSPSPLDRSVLVLIDIQREYRDGRVPLANVDAAADEAGRLLDLARRKGVPVIHIAHDAAGPGAPAFASDGPYRDFLTQVTPREGETVLFKTHANAFIGTGLADRIKETGRNEIIIAGDTVGVCVSTTARAAAEEYGLRVTLVADAIAARDIADPLGGTIAAETVRRVALAELADMFAVVVKDSTAWKE